MTTATIKTAAGETVVIKSAKSVSRGGTTMFLGTIADGRYVVSSRFQYEILTKDIVKAERVFVSLTSGGE